MPDLSLIDAAVILFVIIKMTRANSVSLGDSLHGLIVLLLILALLMGLRVASELKDVLTGLAEFLQTIPGLGAKILIAVGTWYLMRFIRTGLGHWLESVIPDRLHKPITPVSEAFRAVALAGIIVWLFEGLFSANPNDNPTVVNLVRQGDAWLAANVDHSEPAKPAPYPHPMYPSLPYHQPTPPPPLGPPQGQQTPPKETE